MAALVGRHHAPVRHERVGERLEHRPVPEVAVQREQHRSVAAAVAVGDPAAVEREEAGKRHRGMFAARCPTTPATRSPSASAARRSPRSTCSPSTPATASAGTPRWPRAGRRRRPSWRPPRARTRATRASGSSTRRSAACSRSTTPPPGRSSGATRSRPGHAEALLDRDSLAFATPMARTVAEIGGPAAGVPARLPDRRRRAVGRPHRGARDPGRREPAAVPAPARAGVAAGDPGRARAAVGARGARGRRRLRRRLGEHRDRARLPARAGGRLRPRRGVDRPRARQRRGLRRRPTASRST